jgi:uncharacterized protein with PIN domain
MLGYVTEYDSKADDNNLLQSSNDPDAILLTRDEELHNRAVGRKIRSVLVLGSNEETRLGQLASTLGISLEVDMSATRCPECGSELHEITREEAVSTVPAKSLELYDRFWRCTKGECGKTYWAGSHWTQIRRTLEEARKMMSSEMNMKC